MRSDCLWHALYRERKIYHLHSPPLQSWQVAVLTPRGDVRSNSVMKAAIDMVFMCQQFVVGSIIIFGDCGCNCFEQFACRAWWTIRIWRCRRLMVEKRLGHQGGWEMDKKANLCLWEAWEIDKGLWSNLKGTHISLCIYIELSGCGKKNLHDLGMTLTLAHHVTECMRHTNHTWTAILIMDVICTNNIHYNWMSANMTSAESCWHWTCWMVQEQMINQQAVQFNPNCHFA